VKSRSPGLEPRCGSPFLFDRVKNDRTPYLSRAVESLRGRLRLVKIAARVVELKTQLKIHLPSSTPDQAIFAALLGRRPRLVT
jgi:hypothetical protein